MKRKCLGCGTEFVPKNGKQHYCSKRCYHRTYMRKNYHKYRDYILEWIHRHTKTEKIKGERGLAGLTRICQYCGVEYVISKGSFHQKYCSSSCRYLASLKRQRQRRKKKFVDDPVEGRRFGINHYPDFKLGTSEMTTSLGKVETRKGIRIKGALWLERQKKKRNI